MLVKKGKNRQPGHLSRKVPEKLAIIERKHFVYTNRPTQSVIFFNSPEFSMNTPHIQDPTPGAQRQSHKTSQADLLLCQPLLSAAR